MSITVRIPKRFDVATRFFGRFSWKDLLRIGMPALVAYAAVPSTTPAMQIGAVTAGSIAGLALYLVRPRGRTVDNHLYHAVRWLLQKQSVAGSDASDNSSMSSREARLSSLKERIPFVDASEQRSRQTKTGATDRIQRGDGTVIGVIKVQPTNLEMKTEPEQGALHDAFKELFESVTYPVQVFSHQEPFDLFGYSDRMAKNGKEPERLRKAYWNYCREIAQDRLLDTTTHYVVVRVPKESFRQSLENRVSELDSRCKEVENALSSGDLNAERVTGGELNEFKQSVNTAKPDPTTSLASTPGDGKIGTARKTVAITEYPNHLTLGWTKELLEVEGQVDITQRVVPQSPASASKQLQRVVQKLSAEIDSWVNAGYLGTNDLEQRLDDADWMLDRLSSRKDQPFTYAVYVTAKGDTIGECRDTYRKVVNRLETMQIDYDDLLLRTDQALKAWSPLYGDPVDTSQLVPGSSAAVGFPFATQSVDQQQGVVYGEDANDRTPILLNRFDWSSHSMVRMGTTGSGKSYATKLELIRAWMAYDDLQIYVVDPKQEYGHLIRQLGGKMYTLGEDSRLGFKTEDIYGYQVAERGQAENVDRLTNVIQQIYEAVSELDTKALVVIDEAHQLMEDDDGKQVLSRFVREARDTDTAVTLVSQNASDFTHCREGQTILDNMPAKAFHRHERVPDDVIQYFNLSQREEQELYKLKDGTDADYSEAVLKVSDRVDAKIRIEASGAAHAVIA